MHLRMFLMSKLQAKIIAGFHLANLQTDLKLARVDSAKKNHFFIS